ncbi:MAG TPA: hypothetical protein VH105_21765 [Burkholderiales bacterium]|jgi:hypothetical protein|nr:hypothetical protein [Burkholderiales bacterium]
MAIIALQQVNLFAVPANVEAEIGRNLCMASFMHFTQYLGQVGIGLGYHACNAAVAVAANAQYDPVNLANGQQFSALYGTSRLFQGLDPDFNLIHNNVAPGRPFSSSAQGEHAEQSAIRVATAQGLPFWNHGGHFHIYIDLTPCPNCTAWLTNDPGNWYVHYFANLGNQAPVVNEKKRKRAHEFGRQMEPAMKVSKSN